MNNQIERPLFSENQILGAADLTSAFEHGRGQQARHQRMLHVWGIATGLELSGEEKQAGQGAAYQEITLSAGLAIDATGREIVVPEAQRLSEDLFDQLNVAINDAEAYYPVFLIGRDEAAQTPPLAVGACQTTQPTRRVEGHEIRFGQPGAELNWEVQDSPGIADGPGNGAGRILLGFVQWDALSNRFTNVKPESDGVRRRYAGVQASVVAAHSGELTLRTTTNNKAGTPAVVIDQDAEFPLQFGKLTAQGTVKPVFSVNEKGDVKAEGTITATFAVGSVQIQSGSITDGMRLPLPPGITEEQVAEEQVTLHVHLTPRLPGAARPDSNPDWVAVPFECGLEGESRRVQCRFRWFRLGAITDPPQDVPGACDYMLTISVPPTSGGAS